MRLSFNVRNHPPLSSLKSFVTLILCLLLTTFFLTGAMALPEFLGVAKASYEFKSKGKLDSAGCNLCHSGVPNGKNLNLYGKDVKPLIETVTGGKLTSAALHTLDSKDSDGDGFSNADEFKADTLPGDAASKPPGLPPSKTTHLASAGNEGSFSLASTLLARNAQHPAIVHFPIALFLFSLFLDVVGILRKEKALHSAAFYNLVAAAVSSVLSICTGLLAWQLKLQGASLTGDLLLHLILAIVTSLLLCILWAVRVRQRTESRPFTNVYLVLAVIASILIAITGHLGGVISGVAG